MQYLVRESATAFRFTGGLAYLDQVWGPVHSASESPRRELVPAEARGDERLGVGDPVVLHQAESTAPLAMTAVHDVQGELVDDQRVARLRHFDRQDVGLSVAGADQSALSVLPLTGTPTTGVRFHREEPFAGAVVDPAYDRPTDAQEVSGGDPVRHDVGERLPDNVAGVAVRFPVSANWGWALWVEHRVLWNDHL